MSTQWNSGINDRKLKEEICEIGRRVYNKGFAAANDGNISIRVGENEVLCSPTMICKGFMTPDDICAVDMEGVQIAGKRKRTSEVLLHLAIMKHRPDVKAVVHCHPPHATAFAVAREPIPQCILPEIEVFMGEVPIAPYETPGGHAFANTVVPFLGNGTNTIILTNHGTVTFGKSLAQVFRNTLNLEIAARLVANLVAETSQITGQLVVIDILGKLPGTQEFKIFQCLPTVFHRVKRGVENNAVRVQMRVQRAGGFVGEQRGGKIAGQTAIPGTSQTNPSGGEFFKFLQGTAHRPRMGIENAFIRAEEGRQ